VEIAVFVGTGGVTAPIQEPGKIQIYHYTVWNMGFMPQHAISFALLPGVAGNARIYENRA